MNMKRLSSISRSAVLTSALLPIMATGSTHAEGYYSIQDGVLERPTDYREWVYVGTPVTPNDMNNGKAPFPEFHNV